MNWSKPYSSTRLSLPSEAITTDRLSLRIIKESDLDKLWLMDSDPEVMQFIRPAKTDKKAYMAEMKNDLEKGVRFKFFRIIEDKTTGELLGWLLFRPTENEQWVEIGYRLLKQNWGKGYAPEACNAIINLAFNEWELDEVIAVLKKENKNSAKVAEKLGMAYQGQTKEFYEMDLALYLIKNPNKG